MVFTVTVSRPGTPLFHCVSCLYSEAVVDRIWKNTSLSCDWLMFVSCHTRAFTTLVVRVLGSKEKEELLRIPSTVIG